MVNLQDDGTKLVVVAQRTGSSMWEKITAIIWPGGTTEVPSDRSLPEIGVLVRVLRKQRHVSSTP